MQPMRNVITFHFMTEEKDAHSGNGKNGRKYSELPPMRKRWQKLEMKKNIIHRKNWKDTAEK